MSFYYSMPSDPFFEPNGLFDPNGNKILTPNRAPVSPSGPLVINQPRPYDLLLRELDNQKNRAMEAEDELAKAQADVKRGKEQIAHDATIITSLQARIAELEELVEMQKATIVNQSKTIAEPKTLAHRQSAAPLNPVTPSRQIIPQHSLDASFSTGHLRNGGPPPRFSLPAKPMTGGLPPNGQALLSPLYRARTCRYSMPSRSPVHNVFTIFKGPGKVPPFDFEEKATAFGTQLQGLWAKSEAFGHKYATEPNAWKDSHLDQRVKDYAMAISDSKVASYLLNNPVTRPLQVAKAINFYLVRDVLKITVIKGFNNMVDVEIDQIKHQLRPGESFTSLLSRCALESFADQIWSQKLPQLFVT
jgi:hypothetical protein